LQNLQLSNLQQKQAQALQHRKLAAFWLTLMLCSLMPTLF
jgi:hypothetical protein